jgi:hypothetical protein
MIAASNSTTLVSSTSAATTSGSTSGTTTGLDAYQMDLAVAYGSGSSDDSGSGILALAGGDAVAVGENTLAIADVTAQASGDDISSEAYASSTLAAAATSSPDSIAYASTTSYAEVYGDADRSFSLSFNEATLTLTDTAAVSTSVSVSEAYALDIENVLGTGTSTPDILSPEPDLSGSTIDGSLEGGEEYDLGDFDLVLDGNVALADIDAMAFGENSLVEVEFSALAVEDQLSSVTVTTLVAVA